MSTSYRVTRLLDTFVPKPLWSPSEELVYWLVQKVMSGIQKTTWLPAPPSGFYRCGRCTHCSSSSDTKHFCHPLAGKRLNIKSFTNCSTTHIAHTLNCPHQNSQNSDCSHERCNSKTWYRGRYVVLQHKFWSINKNLKLLKRKAFWIYTLKYLLIWNFVFLDICDYF